MKKYSLEIRWGFIFTGAMLLWMVLERVVGLHDEHIDMHLYLTNLFAIPAIAIYAFALIEKRNKLLGGKMTYKEGFMTGLGVTLVVVLLSPFAQWVISTLISPNYFENVIEYALEKGYMASREAAEDQFNLSSYMVQSTVGALIMGVVTSAIVAIFTRRKTKI